MQVHRRVSVLNEDGSVLTPIVGASHSDPFQITTEPSASGWQPYLMGPHDPPRFQFDRRTGRSEIGQITVRVQDARVGGDNLARWASAFVGDSDGWDQFHGKTLLREIQFDGGAWADEWSGIITKARAPDPKTGGAVLELFAQAESILGRDRRLFRTAPHSSITYAHGASVLPLGVPTDWNAGWKGVLPITGEMYGTGISLGALGPVLGAVLGVIPQEERNRMSAGLARVADAREWVPSLSATICANARVWVKRMDTLAEGEFYLSVTAAASAGVSYDGGFRGPVYIHDGYVSRVGITPLRDVSHAKYMALPPSGTEVRFYVYNAGEPSPDVPYLIGSVHPATLVRDILDGKFGVINDEWRDGFEAARSDGSVALRPMRYNEASIAALEADTSFDDLRFTLDRGWNMRDFLAEQVFRVCHIAGVIKGDGAMYLEDLRLGPDTLIGAQTIDTASIIRAEWEAGADMAPAINVTAYQDAAVLAEPPAEEPIAQLNVTRTEARALPQVFASPKLRDFSDVNALSIDALGVRYASGDPQGPGRGFGSREARVAEPYLAIFGTGAAYAKLVVQRATETQDIYPGDVRIIDADAIPNFASNERGGLRLMQCVLAVPKYPEIELRMLDLGPGTAALTPVLTSVVKNASSPTNAIDVSFTLNPQSEPITIEIATTATSVAVKPADDAAEWRRYGGRPTAAGTVTIGNLEDGMRHWVRLRSVPPRKLPSAYEDGLFADTDSATAITSFTLTLQADGTVLAEWTVSAATAGLRLSYEAHGSEDVPTLPASVDVDASLGEYSFARSLVNHELFTVEAEPYPTFAAGAVSGTPGDAVAASVTTIIADLISILSFDPIRSSADGSQVTYRGVCGALVTEVWLYSVTFAQPVLIADPWTYAEDNVRGLQVLAPDADRAFEVTFDVPAEGDATYVLVRPFYLRANGQREDGFAWNMHLDPSAVSPAIIDTDDAETGTVGYWWIKPQRRGINVASITMGTQQHKTVLSGLAVTRGEGDTSVVTGETMGADEYEGQVTKSQLGDSWIWFDIVWSDGSTERLLSPPFGPNEQPWFLPEAPRVTGTLVLLFVTYPSINVTRTDGGGTWEIDRDGVSSFDVSEVDDSGNAGLSSGSGTYTVTIYSDSTANRDGDTLSASKSITVHASGSSPTHSIDLMTASAPAIGGTAGTLELRSTSATPDVTTEMRYRVNGGLFSSFSAVAGASPSPAPTSTTAYSLPGLPTRRADSGGDDPPQYQVDVEVRSTLESGATEYDTEERGFSYTTNADDV